MWLKTKRLKLRQLHNVTKIAIEEVTKPQTKNQEEMPGYVQRANGTENVIQK